MANVTFVLKEPTSKEETLIYLIFRYDNQRFKYSTGQKLEPKFWNPEKQRVKETRQFPDYAEFNAYLNNLESKTNTIYRKFINDGIAPSPDKLRSGLNEVLFKTDTGIKNDFISFVSDIIDQSNRKYGTVKHYRQTLLRLKEFKSHTKNSLTFESITLTFYNNFIKYCTEQNYGINTIGGYIKDIKTFMGEAIDRKLTTNLEFRSKKFKKLQEETDSIYLTMQEIAKLENLDLDGNNRLDRVRDLFLIGCFTGLRFSDLIQIHKRNIINEGTKLKIKTEKTGGTVIIPLSRKIKEIIAKYNGNLPTDISNQKMNEYLKELGNLAGINDKVAHTSTKGGSKEITVYKKYELLTVHTARRSFATNAYLTEIPTLSIMKITGHKTEKAFLTYIKMSEEDNANKLINHPFFN